MFLLVIMMVGSADSSDLELVQRAKKGDKRAFGDLVRRHQRKVYALCFRLGGSHDAADDLTQEAFIKAFQAISTFDEAYPFIAWIMRIASNNALNYIKRQKFQVSGEEGELVIDAQTSSHTEDNPHENLNQQEIDARYQQALNALPPDFRTVFVLRMHEEISYEEIAQRLKISVGTVMSRLHRARQRMASDLKDLLEP